MMPTEISARRYLVTGGSGFIGTNFVEELSHANAELLNLDISAPLCPSHERFWCRGDILDDVSLGKVFADFQPTHVVHMAGRTDCDENTTVDEGYISNTQGTRNIVGVIQNTPGIERVIMVSSQYVCGPRHFPQHDEDYAPHTVYGQSKVEMEQIVRKAQWPCVWTLVRPANIWGPWHLRYRREFWHVMRRGLYVHPGGAPVVRTYGYVGNVIWQLQSLFNADPLLVDRQTFYLGDMPADIRDWTNAFSMAIRGKPVRSVPRYFLQMLGWCGDVAKALGMTPPITSSRFHSMIEDYPTPMQKTFDTLGPPPVSLGQAVERTLQWLNQFGWYERAEASEPERT